MNTFLADKRTNMPNVVTFTHGYMMLGLTKRRMRKMGEICMAH